jgi:hypothetical protein
MSESQGKDEKLPPPFLSYRDDPITQAIRNVELQKRLAREKARPPLEE